MSSGRDPLDLDELFEDLFLELRRLFRGNWLIARGGQTFEPDHFVIKLAALDLEAFAFGDHGVAEEVGGFGLGPGGIRPGLPLG